MENENLVTEEVTENVENTTEETIETQPQGKFYTDEELDTKLSDRYTRGKIRGEREAKRKYGRIENILKQGLGVETLEEAEEELSRFYAEKGISINHENEYDDDDIRTLATSDARDIINNGYMAVETELQRLADLGVENMTKREKVMFEKLHNEHQLEKGRKELASIGVSSDVLESKDFKEFSNKLNPNLSVKEKYEIYQSTQPKPDVEPMGSMTNTDSSDNGVKEFYTYDEAIKFSKDDFDKNPELFKAVENSMYKW